MWSSLVKSRSPSALHSPNSVGGQKNDNRRGENKTSLPALVRLLSRPFPPRAAPKRLELRKVRDAIAANFATSLDGEQDDLEETVNAALRFIHEGKLEQIETAARHLMERYPDIPDGWEFLGHVHEKRGENREAVACYRRVLEIINRSPDDFDPEFTQRFEDQIAKLDQPQAT